MGTELIAVNQQRIDYLIKLFGFTSRTLLDHLNQERKQKIEPHDLFAADIKLARLRDLDKIFGQGLAFYTDPAPIATDKQNSIFFRKQKFNTELNLADRQKVCEMESELSNLSALAFLSEYQLSRKLPVFTLADSPADVALVMRERLYPKRQLKDDKKFLERLIDRLSEQDILVLEFVEAHNKKEKTSIDGMFLAPHGIVLKRQRGSYKREIFTLAHELGHYLLNIEELDKIELEQFNPGSASPTIDTIERWCNDFAFAFLLDSETFNLLRSCARSIVNEGIAQEQLVEIGKDHHISRSALLTGLLRCQDISCQEYSWLQNQLKEHYQRIDQQSKLRRQLEQETGKKPQARSPSPIRSTLDKDIFRYAYLSGAASEYELLQRFKVRNFDAFVYG